MTSRERQRPEIRAASVSDRKYVCALFFVAHASGSLFRIIFRRSRFRLVTSHYFSSLTLPARYFALFFRRSRFRLVMKTPES
jgi:hypothetical protein